MAKVVSSEPAFRVKQLSDFSQSNANWGPALEAQGAPGACAVTGGVGAKVSGGGGLIGGVGLQASGGVGCQLGAPGGQFTGGNGLDVGGDGIRGIGGNSSFIQGARGGFFQGGSGSTPGDAIVALGGGTLPGHPVDQGSGVIAQTNSTRNAGVLGQNLGSGPGVQGTSANGIGVLGQATSDSDASPGVYGSATQGWIAQPQPGSRSPPQ